MMPCGPLLPSAAAPVRGRGAVGAFGRGLLLLSEKQTTQVGLVYLPVQRVNLYRTYTRTYATMRLQ